MRRWRGAKTGLAIASPPGRGSPRFVGPLDLQVASDMVKTGFMAYLVKTAQNTILSGKSAGGGLI